VSPNKEGGPGFGESSVSLDLIQHHLLRLPIREATGLQLVIKSWSVRAFVSPLDYSQAGPGAHRSFVTSRLFVIYLLGKIAFLGREAGCQEPSKQDGCWPSCS
jgi:hypothetical protein